MMKLNSHINILSTKIFDSDIFLRGWILDISESKNKNSNIYTSVCKSSYRKKSFEVNIAVIDDFHANV